jgi:hypothetical protein
VKIFTIPGTQKKIDLQWNHAKHDGAKQRPNPLVLKILLEPEESFTSFTTPSAVSMSSSCGWFRASMQELRIPRHENNHSELKKIIVPR